MENSTGRFAVCSLFIHFLLAAVLLVSPLRAENIVHLGVIKVPAVYITNITAELTDEDSIVLTASVNYESALAHPRSDLEVVWEIKGEGHGYSLSARSEKEKIDLEIGDRLKTVTVQACVTNGIDTGGCRTIEIKSDLIEQCESEKMWKEIRPQEWDDYICMGVDDDSFRYVFFRVRSHVNTVTGAYVREKTDLSLKVSGGVLSVKRKYTSDTGWQWEHERHALSFNRDDNGNLKHIEKGEIIYRASAGEKGSFIHGSYTITENDAAFLWEDRKGRWKSYDREGKLLSFGDRNGTVGRYLYRDGFVRAMADREGKTVILFYHDDEGRITGVNDRNSRMVSYGYDGERLTYVSDVQSKETRYDYDDEGYISKVIDHEGNEIIISHDRSGKVASILNGKGEGHKFKFRYDRTRKLYYVRIENTEGPVKEIWFTKKGEAREVRLNNRVVRKIEKKGRKLFITGGLGGVTVKEFDKKDNLVKITHPDGTHISYLYHPVFHRRVKEVNERGIVTTYGYDDKGNMTRKTEAVGTKSERISEYAYDETGNRIEIRRLPDEKTRESLIEMLYDPSGNMISRTDPEGYTTHFSHDLMGNVTKKQDPAGNAWRYDYDRSGNLIMVTNPMGFRMSMFYDAFGRKVMESDFESNYRRYTYDDNGYIIKVRDKEANLTYFEYNLEGKVTKKTDQEGKVTAYEYDLDRRLVKSIDGTGNVTEFQYEATGEDGCLVCSGEESSPSRIIFPTFAREFVYDKRGRKVGERDITVQGEVLTSFFEYDATGNQIAKRDMMGNVTRYGYDELNRPVKVTDPLGHVTEYSYDDRDNLLSLRDANGNVTFFEYDRNNRLVKETKPLGQETKYIYDGLGNLVSKKDPMGQITEYTYDKMGRLLSAVYFKDVGDKIPLRKVTFTSDRTGNVTGYEDGTTSAEYFYDREYRRLKEIVDFGGFRKSFEYTYYKNGKKKSFRMPEGDTYEYLYDENNNLKAVRIPGMEPVKYGAFVWNRPGAVMYPGGTTRSVVYDPLMRIKEIKITGPGKDILMNVRYHYDKMGNILTSASGKGEYRFTYDSLGRLTGAESPVLDEETYIYDPVGNRLKNKKAEMWSYNGNNELLACDGRSFVYDANGNTIQKREKDKITTLSYSLENRLETVIDGSGNVIAKYYYDPFGRRLWKEVENRRTYFLYSEGGLMAEYDGDGDIIREYGYRPGSVWTTDPLFMKQDGDYYFYHNDHLGTPQKLTEKSGKTVWRAEYNSFGGAALEIEEVVNNLRFSGQYYDSETGLHYNYHRYYDPSIGRYLTADPIGLKGGINIFSYARNNPLKFSDYNGLWCGTSTSDWLVPDKPAGYDFSECCRKHDWCYEGQKDDEGNDQCWKLQEDCDEGFRKCMKSVCEKEEDEITFVIPDIPTAENFGSSRSDCERIADDYWYGVDLLGFESFSRAREKSLCNCETN